MDLVLPGSKCCEKVFEICVGQGGWFLIPLLVDLGMEVEASGSLCDGGEACDRSLPILVRAPHLRDTDKGAIGDDDICFLLGWLWSSAVQEYVRVGEEVVQS